MNHCWARLTLKQTFDWCTALYWTFQNSEIKYFLNLNNMTKLIKNKEIQNLQSVKPMRTTM